jgi:hypothetical protein
VYRQTLGVHRLEAEESQAEVVTDVGVREEDAIQRLAIDATARTVAPRRQPVELLAHIGSRIDQKRLFASEDRQARHQPAPRRIAPRRITAGATARSVRQATILRGTEGDNAHRWRRYLASDERGDSQNRQGDYARPTPTRHREILPERPKNHLWPAFTGTGRLEDDTVARMMSRAFLVAIVALLLGAAGVWSTETDRSPTPEARPCDVFPPDEPSDRLERCAIADENGSLALLPEALAHPRLRSAQRVELLLDNRFYFANARGKLLRAYPFDNGPDPFVEGLARVLAAGKVGFVNADLEEVVPPTWVCKGCVVSALEPGDEHHVPTGGVWGYIDRQGNVVVEVVHDLDKLPPPRKVTAD